MQNIGGVCSKIEKKNKTEGNSWFVVRRNQTQKKSNTEVRLVSGWCRFDWFLVGVAAIQKRRQKKLWNHCCCCCSKKETETVEPLLSLLFEKDQKKTIFRFAEPNSEISVFLSKSN